MIRILCALAGAALATSATATELPQKRVLTLDAARQLADAAVQFARQNNAPGGAIAVVDDAGTTIVLERLDGTFPMGSTVSVGKARTAVLFHKPTRFFEDTINKGRFSMTALDDFTPLQGGIPIEIEGQVVGGIGVSGSLSAQQDSDIADAALKALPSILSGKP